jgi:hypothetical protein
MVAAPLVAKQPVLKLPVYAAPHPAADMRAAVSALDFGVQGTGKRTIPLEGLPLLGSSPPTTTRSLVSALELHLRSPRRSQSQSPATPGVADIQYVGMASDAPAAGSIEDARLVFGISTYAPWSTPSEVALSIFIDSTGDNIPDFEVYTTDARSVMELQRPSDAFVAGVRRLSDGDVQMGDPLNALLPLNVPTALYQSNVVLISLPAALLELTPQRSMLSITVQTRVRYDTRLPGDSTPPLRFDPAHPGLNVTGGRKGLPVFTDAPSTTLTVGFDQRAYSTSTARGLLLLHHHNGAGQRAEVVEVRYGWPHHLYFPIGGR